MNHPPPALDAYLADASEELERLASACVPDFADVLARARRLSAGEPEPSLAAARGLDALDDDALERATYIGGLDELLHSAREEAALHAEHIEQAELPPVPVPMRRAATRWAGLAVLAAAIVAALALGWGLRADRVLLGRSHGYSGASRTHAPQVWSQALLDVTPRAAARAPRTAGPRTSAPVPSVAPLPSVAPRPQIVAPTQRVAPRRASVPVDALTELDRTARAAWQRGELAAAEAALEQLVARGRRGALVDIAYGDLFELARQRRDPAKEARLWRRYLKAFPRGRYSDDAHAGLCRAAQGDAAIVCWRRYLDARPSGTWREQARTAIARAVDPKRPPQ
jgi:hypothetical protein